MPGIPARRIARSTPTWLCGCAGGCGSSTRAGDASAGAIHGRATKAPPDERGGNRHARPTATAPHLDSTMDYTYREPHGEAIYRFNDDMLPTDFLPPQPRARLPRRTPSRLRNLLAKNA